MVESGGRSGQFRTSTKGITASLLLCFGHKPHFWKWFSGESLPFWLYPHVTWYHRWSRAALVESLATWGVIDFCVVTGGADTFVDIEGSRHIFRCVHKKHFSDIRWQCNHSQFLDGNTFLGVQHLRTTPCICDCNHVWFCVPLFPVCWRCVIWMGFIGSIGEPVGNQSTRSRRGEYV